MMAVDWRKPVQVLNRGNKASWIDATVLEGVKLRYPDERLLVWDFFGDRCGIFHRESDEVRNHPPDHEQVWIGIIERKDGILRVISANSRRVVEAEFERAWAPTGGNLLAVKLVFEREA